MSGVMSWFAPLLRPPNALRLVLLACLAVLAGALVFQHVVGVDPCPLCLWQRWPYVVGAALAGLGVLAAGRRPGPAALLSAACGVAFLIGGGIAAYHVGVEQHWWVAAPSCGGPPAAGTTSLSLDQLRDQIMATPVVRCDVVAWSLFGISLAGFNIMISFALALFSLAAARNSWFGRPLS